MANPGPSPCKLVEDSDAAAFSPQPLGNQKALDLEDVIEFVEPLPDELQCPLCLEFLKEPTLTSCCGHHFCRECINSAIVHSHVCPLCKNQGFQTFLNKEKQRLVNTLKVYCKWKSRGCEWVGELGRLERHLDVEEGDCGCVEVECEFGPVGCVAKLPRKDLQRHKEENVHKHLVLMSIMSLKSNEAFGQKLQEQQVEFQEKLKQKDEELQAIQKSLQQQVDVTQELRGQLQQKDQQIADIWDQLLQKGEQIAAVQQNMETKQQLITNLERQLKAEAEQLARVEVELTENTRQIVKLERSLPDKDQQLTTYEQRNEKQLEMKQQEEVSRQVAEVDGKVRAAKTQLQQGCNQTVVELPGLRKGIEQVDTSLEEEQEQMKEFNEKLEKSNEAFGKKLQEHRLELEGQFRRPASNSFPVIRSDVANHTRSRPRTLANAYCNVGVPKFLEEKQQRVAKQPQEQPAQVETMPKVSAQTHIQRGSEQTNEEMASSGRTRNHTRTLVHEYSNVAVPQSREQKQPKIVKQPQTPPSFTMTDFEQYKRDDVDWFSPPFYSHTGGYRMCLRVHAKGQDRGEGTDVSVLVHLMRGDHDDHLKWPFQGDITVQLLNQRREEEHMERTICFDENAGSKYKSRVTGRFRAVNGWGYSKFIAHSALGYNSAKNTEYLRNNCLKFRVTEIKVKNF